MHTSKILSILDSPSFQTAMILFMICNLKFFCNNFYFANLRKICAFTKKNKHILSLPFLEHCVKWRNTTSTFLLLFIFKKQTIRSHDFGHTRFLVNNKSQQYDCLPKLKCLFISWKRNLFRRKIIAKNCQVTNHQENHGGLE